MTEYQMMELQKKMEDGTITRKELRKLKAMESAGGKTGRKYGEKRTADVFGG